MKHHLLNVVVLARDLPEQGLKAGDLGTIVEVYERGDVEVEFATVSGRAQAILTLNENDVRPAAGSDMPSVRSQYRV